MDPPGYSPDEVQVQVQVQVPTTPIMMKQKKKKQKKTKQKKKQRPPSPPPSRSITRLTPPPPPLIMKSPTTTPRTTRTASSFSASFSSSPASFDDSLGALEDVEEINEMFRRLDSYDSSVDLNDDSNNDDSSDSDDDDDIPMEISTGKQMYIKPLNRIASPKPIKKKSISIDSMTTAEGYVSTSDKNNMCQKSIMLTKTTPPPLTNKNETPKVLSPKGIIPSKLTKALSLKDVFIGTPKRKKKKKVSIINRQD